MTARAVMVLGTSSGAGKRWLATALCRRCQRQGAAFKAQNMSNNARVVPADVGHPGEIGSSQDFQALAARDALDALMEENDLVEIEGAGSPAEINLHVSDCVNMRTALHARAACLLVTDIDRDGAFAHLHGSHPLLPADERALIRGYVLNRFRGDAALLAPGPQALQQLTGVSTLAVLPMWRGHGLPEEDGVFDAAASGARGGVHAHGLFESAAAMRALFGAVVRPLDAMFDGQADFIDARFEPGSFMRLIESAA